MDFAGTWDGWIFDILFVRGNHEFSQLSITNEKCVYSEFEARKRGHATRSNIL